MKAHFIASTVNLLDDIKSYSLIVDALKKHDVQLTSEWLEEAMSRAKETAQDNTQGDLWQNIYRQNLDAISKADIIVAEVGQKSFLVGFQVSNALQMKKPILLLSRFNEVDSAVGVSLHEEIIKFAQYNDDNIEKVIAEFIEENSSGGKDIRFNFFINRRLLNYLNWASMRSGNTKSEVIRKLLEKEMRKSNFHKS